MTAATFPPRTTTYGALGPGRSASIRAAERPMNVLAASPPKMPLMSAMSGW
jgi:hypothetical protein